MNKRLQGARLKHKFIAANRNDLEILIAGRLLLLANDMLGNKTAQIAEMAPTYLKASRVWLRNFWQTGRFRAQGSFYEVAQQDI